MTETMGVAREQLRSYVERIERLEEEKKTIAEDIKDVYGEAKAMGFDTKVLRRVIKIRSQDQNERLEFEALVETYLGVLGLGGQGLVDPVRMEAAETEQELEPA